MRRERSEAHRHVSATGAAFYRYYAHDGFYKAVTKDEEEGDVENGEDEAPFIWNAVKGIVRRWNDPQGAQMPKVQINIHKCTQSVFLFSVQRY